MSNTQQVLKMHLLKETEKKINAWKHSGLWEPHTLTCQQAIVRECDTLSRREGGKLEFGLWLQKPWF